MAFDFYDRMALNELLRLVKGIVGHQTTELENMTAYKEELDRAISMIQNDTTLHGSVLTTLQTMTTQLGALEQQLRQAGDDPAADQVSSMLDAWQSSQDAIQAAIASSLPAPPA